METIADTALPVLPLESPEFSANPQPWLEAARKQHPWLARFSAGYVVHGYEAARDLFADEENMIAGFNTVVDFYGLQDSMWGRFLNGTLSATVGEQHDRLRACLAPAFTPRSANLARGLMQRVITELLDEWAPLGRFDFADFASFFPVSVMCGLLGVPAEQATSVRDALESFGKALNLKLEYKPVVLAGFDTIWNLANNVIAEHESRGQYDEDSLLDVMIAAKNAGQMDETELRFMLITLFVAGFDTSKNQLCLTMNQLLDRPEMYRRCGEDLAYCRKVTEESLRYSAIVSKFRAAKQDFRYQGWDFRKGDTLVLSSPLANRDPAYFDDPMDFNPDRKNAGRNLALGRGGHICLGQHIARAQIQEGLHLIAQRLRNPRRDGPVGWRPMLGAWGLTSLPIAFDPT
jgi:cytochrome P450